MNDRASGDDTEPPSTREKPHWILRCIRDVKCYFQKRRAEKKKESAQHRFIRRTANATGAIAFFTFVTIGVGIGQYVIFSRQLSEAQKEFVSTQRAFIFLKSIDRQIEPLGKDTLIKWRETWRNNGMTQPKKLLVWEDCHDEWMNVPLDFHRRVAQFSMFVGPNSEQTWFGCETSASFLKQLDTDNLARARNRDNKRRLLYVLGGATYLDIFDTPHAFEYCYQLMWDNRQIDLGFELSPCFGVNTGHNCVDGEMPKIK